MITLTHYLVLGAALFCVGLYGVMTRRNAIALLISTELIFNAVNINMVAFSRFQEPGFAHGEMFAIFVIAVAAAESVLGLAIILAIYRSRQTVNSEEMKLMKW